MELSWVVKKFGFHGVVVLQANSLSQIQTSGMVDIMDIHLDMKLMDMPQLLKIPICTTETILDMETTSNHPNSSRGGGILQEQNPHHWLEQKN